MSEIRIIRTDGVGTFTRTLRGKQVLAIEVDGVLWGPTEDKHAGAHHGGTRYLSQTDCPGCGNEKSYCDCADGCRCGCEV